MNFNFIKFNPFATLQSLLLLEEQEGSVNFKFGVLYAKAGQGSDDEMFSNGTHTHTHNFELIPPFLFQIILNFNFEKRARQQRV